MVFLSEATLPRENSAEESVIGISEQRSVNEVDWDSLTLWGSGGGASYPCPRIRQAGDRSARNTKIGLERD